MINNKLGLKIVRINEGYTDLLEVNGAQEWTKYIRDVREELKLINNIREDSIIFMLTTIENGNIITIAHPINGRITDVITAWIYIPIDLLISGKNLVDIIEVTKKEILAVKRNDELLKSKFENNYDIAQAKRTCQHAVGNQYAYRYYSNDLYTLQELLDAIHQPYYQKYKSIFLIDRSSKLSCIVGDDLSKEPLYTSILADTPKKVDGFIPYVDGKVFDSPMYVSEGEVIEITWRKNDYEPIRTRTEINEGFTYIEPTENQYRRLIPYEAVRVVDEWKQPIEEYKLSINQHAVNTGETIPVNEAALNNVRIDISADGYDSKEEIVDFTKDKTKIIQLSKVTYEYKLAIPLDNKDSFIELEPIITHKELKKSPIKGYKPKKGRFIQKKITYLKYYPYDKFFWIQVAVVLSVVLILGVALGAWGWNKYKTEELRIENSSLKSDIEQLKSKGGYNYDSENTEENTIEQENDVAKVIEYLDNNNVWNREKMEGFSQIKGLWDAINTHDFGKILELENTLKDSKRFKNLISAIKDNKNKKFTTNYNKDNDFDITIETEKDKTGNVKNKGYIKALYDAGGNSSRSKGVSSNASHHSESGDNNNNQDNWK